jgi:hypothetical protein
MSMAAHSMRNNTQTGYRHWPVAQCDRSQRMKRRVFCFLVLSCLNQNGDPYAHIQYLRRLLWLINTLNGMRKTVSLP